MAVGDATPKKLYQGALSATVTALYTAPSNMRTQIIEIWIDNQNTTTQRNISLYAHGTASTNRLGHKIPVAADTNITLSDNKIILGASDIFAMAQDTGTDCIVTIYGYEEQIS